MEKKYTDVFFDLDHTLWDFEANSRATLDYLYHEFRLDEKGIRVFDDFCVQFEQHNERLWVLLRNGVISREELRWRRMDMALTDFCVWDRELAVQLSDAYLEVLPKQHRLLQGAVDLLEYCKQKYYRLHIITNGFEATQWQKLRTSNIGHYFEHVFTSDKANSMKPHSPIFTYALQQAATTPKSSIMIGDSLEADIIGALDMGIDQIYFNPQSRPHDTPVTYEVNSLSAIQAIL